LGAVLLLGFDENIKPANIPSTSSAANMPSHFHAWLKKSRLLTGSVFAGSFFIVLLIF
jgi:hypothetical protein